jgi:hypothetical protein
MSSLVVGHSHAGDGRRGAVRVKDLETPAFCSSAPT